MRIAEIVRGRRIIKNREVVQIMKRYFYKVSTAVALLAALAVNGLACSPRRAYRARYYPNSYVTTRTYYTPVSRRVYYTPVRRVYNAPVNRYYVPSNRVYYAPQPTYYNDGYYNNGYYYRRGHSTRDKILTVAVPAA